jgi:hypothetical protein
MHPTARLDDDQGPVGRLSIELLDEALTLARGSGRPAHEILADFAETVTRLVDAWPSRGWFFLPIVQRLCEELPIALTPSLWRLLVRLRAE